MHLCRTPNWAFIHTSDISFLWNRDLGFCTNLPSLLTTTPIWIFWPYLSSRLSIHTSFHRDAHIDLYRIHSQYLIPWSLFKVTILPSVSALVMIHTLKVRFPVDLDPGSFWSRMWSFLLSDWLPVLSDSSLFSPQKTSLRILPRRAPFPFLSWNQSFVFHQISYLRHRVRHFLFIRS